MDTGAVLDEGLRKIREFLRSRPLARANGQAELWNQTGLADIVEVPLVVSFDFDSLEDYWTSLATGPSRGAQRVQAMPAERRDEICRLTQLAYLAGQPDGPRSFAAIIRAVRGVVP
jgi:hypothetical protein